MKSNDINKYYLKDMTKKGFWTTGAMAALCTVALLGSACSQKQTTASTAGEAVAAQADAPISIAYVRMDSVLAEYKYSQEIQTKLAADAEASEKRFQGRAASLQKAAEDFERRVRINAFVSQEVAQAEQNKIVKMQQDVAQLQQELSQQLAQKQALMQEDLMAEIQAQLKVFNGGRFKLILTQMGVLHADEALDITEAFIQHLNETYQTKGATAPVVATDSTTKAK